MAKLPVYTSGAKIDASPVGLQDVRAVGMVGEAVANLGSDLSKTAVIWQKTQDEIETYNADTKFREDMSNIITEANDYRDFSNFKDLDDKKAEIKERMNSLTTDLNSGFSSNANKRDFMYRSNLQKLGFQNRVDEIFRGKTIEQGKAGLAKSYDMNYEAYVMTGDASYKNTYLGDLNRMYGAGVIGKDDLAVAEIKSKEWDKGYIVNLADNNPEYAMELVKNPEYSKYKNEVNSVIKRRVAENDFNIKLEQYNNQIELSETLDSKPPVEALKELEARKGILPTKYYKAKERALLSDLGITAETRADTFSDILLDIGTLDKEDAKTFFNQSNDILAKIEEEYADGRLRIEDKKSLVNIIKKRQGKNLPELVKQDEAWYKFYDFGDVKQDLDKSLANVSKSNDAMLEYFKAVDGQDYNTKQKKELVKTLVSKYNTDSLNKAISSKLNVGDIKAGYKYKGGNVSDPNSWEKI